MNCGKYAFNSIECKGYQFGFIVLIQFLLCYFCSVDRNKNKNGPNIKAFMWLKETKCENCFILNIRLKYSRLTEIWKLRLMTMSGLPRIRIWRNLMDLQNLSSSHRLHAEKHSSVLGPLLGLMGITHRVQLCQPSMTHSDIRSHLTYLQTLYL